MESLIDKALDEVPGKWQSQAGKADARNDV